MVKFWQEESQSGLDNEMSVRFDSPLSTVSSVPSDSISHIPQEILRYFPDPIEIGLLPGGAVNRCYRVRSREGIFAVRIGKPNPENYGFDRDREWHFYKEGECLGVSPILRNYDLLAGVLVMDFIDGPLVDHSLIRQDGGIGKVAHLLRTLHCIECEEEKEPTTLFFIRTFTKKLRSLGFLPDGWKETIGKMIAQTPYSKQLVLCHNDLAFNLMLEKGRFWAIDWECAGWNDPLFDLAPLCIWYDFSQSEKQELLSAYFGELAHEQELDGAIRLVLIFSALWSLLEVAYGNATYHKQAMELFERAVGM